MLYKNNKNFNSFMLSVSLYNMIKYMKYMNVKIE